MDLKSGTPVWRVAKELPNSPSISSDYEAIVIGAGISGALVADALSRAGVRTLVVDERVPGTGSTRASTAILDFQLDSSLLSLSERFGEAVAADIYRAGLQGLRDMRAVGPELAPRSFRKLPSIYAAATEEDAKTLEEEVAMRKRAGIPSEMLDAEVLWRKFRLSAPAAISHRDAFIIDPVETTQALLQRALQTGCSLFISEEAANVTYEGETPVVHLDAGRRIRCSKLIFAAGYETRRWLPIPLGNLVASYVVVLEVDRPIKFAMWETARPYLYTRPLHGNLILAGGADVSMESALPRNLIAGVQGWRIQRRFRRYFPDVKVTVKGSWNGVFGESVDGLPYFGPAPGNANTFFLFATGGNGILFAWIGSKYAVDWINSEGALPAHYFGISRALKGWCSNSYSGSRKE